MICPRCGIWIDRFGRCNCNSAQSLVRAYQPGPYEPGPQGDDQDGCGFIVLRQAAVFAVAIVAMILAVR